MENKVILTLCALLGIMLYYPVIGQNSAPESNGTTEGHKLVDMPGIEDSEAVNLRLEQITSNTTTTNGTSLEADNRTDSDSVENPNKAMVPEETTEEVPSTPTSASNGEEPLTNLTRTNNTPRTQPTITPHTPPFLTQQDTSQSNTTRRPKEANSTGISNPPNKVQTALFNNSTETTTTNASSTSVPQPSSPSISKQPNQDQPTDSFSTPSAQPTVSPGTRPQTSSTAQHWSLPTRPGSPSAQTKVHAETLSRLNVGADATVVREAPSLDPLLAALVSAFVVAAVIITLLVFLKLRRRNSQPEFRRLQDLPMDDMMEDSPLALYTY